MPIQDFYSRRDCKIITFILVFSFFLSYNTRAGVFFPSFLLIQLWRWWIITKISQNMWDRYTKIKTIFAFSPRCLFINLFGHQLNCHDRNQSYFFFFFFFLSLVLGSRNNSTSLLKHFKTEDQNIPRTQQRNTCSFINFYYWREQWKNISACASRGQCKPDFQQTVLLKGERNALKRTDNLGSACISFPPIDAPFFIAHFIGISRQDKTWREKLTTVKPSKLQQARYSVPYVHLSFCLISPWPHCF